MNQRSFGFNKPYQECRRWASIEKRLKDVADIPCKASARFFVNQTGRQRSHWLRNLFDRKSMRELNVVADRRDCLRKSALSYKRALRYISERYAIRGNDAYAGFARLRKVLAGYKA
jgi:hypothetical protein